VGSECFDLETAESKSFSTGPSDAIMWKHKVDNGGLMPDPNNPSRTVIIINNRATGTIQCLIYFKDMVSAANAISHKPDAQVEAGTGWWKRMDSNHRKFMKLKVLIQQNNAARDNNVFLSKLYSVFPGTFDQYIFGKK
jgi:hypothetical protein